MQRSRRSAMNVRPIAGTCRSPRRGSLANNEDVKEFYLGGGEQRKSLRNLKSFKRCNRWL